MPYLRCTEEECGHLWAPVSRFEDQCPECGSPALPVDPDEDERAEELLAVPGRPGREEQAHPGHARETARRVLAEHNISKPPVPVHAIARRVGLEVVEVETLGSLSARLIDTRIEVVASESAGRKRFSIAHELGHYFLHTVHGTNRQIEREADAFAGELLVPGHFLHNAVARTTSIDQLRQLFQVSRQALEIAAQTHKITNLS